ncbi:MlaD family protein [Halomonas icarae]|uniref:MCE family protein n=1 Tax=Halomonas icarae TaxID=2691040 RepID=A0A7X4VW70_9GAMM|nr:MlaD family protein [Halomonas icarae]MDR5901017.1 MlaD family protein [Halomonas icarae]NAW11292.1 MCE family protein [Halomonas icarae]
MEPRAHHVLIGLFTVLALGGALLFALWLGKSNLDRDDTWYEVVFDRAVSGLAEGNAVQYSGIEVGNVAELHLDPTDPRRVRALIRIDASVPIKADTRASLALANITGSMNIQLYGGTPESERLRGSRDNPPVIRARPSPLSSLLSNSERLMIRFNRLLEGADRLLSNDNIEHLSHSLANLEQATATLAGTDLDLKALGERLGTTLTQAEATLATYTSLGDRAGRLLDEEGHRTLARAESAMAALEESASRVARLTADHEQEIARGLQGVGELDPAMQELHAALRVLNRLIRRLEESPTEALLGRDPLPEYAP